MKALKILTLLTIGLFFVAGALCFTIGESWVDFVALGRGAWSFITLLIALVIKSIKGSSTFALSDPQKHEFSHNIHYRAIAEKAKNY